MKSSNVGAGILNIVTESLYDEPIVVFREYVQNAVDSFSRMENAELACCEIWAEERSLYFLDNGMGVDENSFFNAMTELAYSQKDRIRNIGYKGIGRMSGLPYCESLTFINILSFKEKRFQKYHIDGALYRSIKSDASRISELSFDELMKKIGEGTGLSDDADSAGIIKRMGKYDSIFNQHDKGFFVILDSISKVLSNVIAPQNGSPIIADLGWLLPVPFRKELFSHENAELFKELTAKHNQASIPARSYGIKYDGIIIERPITSGMLRAYNCKKDFKSAVGFHSFNATTISIDKNNEFSGIRLYIDNMLLCDESEIIPTLIKYDLIDHTLNEMIQTVRGIGAMIYITDKVALSANARRTFIEIVDEDSIDFLRELASFINQIYDVRYALSKYSTILKKHHTHDTEETVLNDLRDYANNKLELLADQKISVDSIPTTDEDFNKSSVIDQKKLLKSILVQYMNRKIKDYLAQSSSIGIDKVVQSFRIWFNANKE
jgi:molecular chaperone HtpG